MTNLVIPSFDRRLLETVKQELAAESLHDWPGQSIELCLDVLRRIREHTAALRPALESVLAEGVEARSFAQDYTPLLRSADEYVAGIRQLTQQVSPREGAVSEELWAELSSLEMEARTFRDLLASALAQACESPRPISWDRVRASEEAHVRGETKPFSR